MEYIRDFKELGKEDAARAGGKGASLGEMTRAGIPVPPGFVILAQTFEYFLQKTDLTQEIESILSSVDHEVMHTIEDASEKIRELILAQTIPQEIAEEIQKNYRVLGVPYVAVRSSATAEDGAEHAWAGQLDSFLNTTEATLLENVKRCWASLFTPRAIFYRFEKGLHDSHISVAVVIQKMVDSEKSGIAFSVHPVTEDRNQMIIEAGFGLGEAIVSGQITPDSYVVTKRPRAIIDVNVSEQSRALYRTSDRSPANPSGQGNEWRELGDKGKEQVLTEEQILELSESIMKVENHYGFPCDIEWAFSNEKVELTESPEVARRAGTKGEFYIVQSRPITTLSGGGNPLVQESNEFPELENFEASVYVFHGRWQSTLLNCYFWTYIWDKKLLSELDVSLSENGYFIMNEGSAFMKKSVTDSVRERMKTALAENDDTFFRRMKDIIDRELPKQLKAGEALLSLEATPESIRHLLKISEPLMFLWYFGYLFSYSFERIVSETAEKEGIDPSEISLYIPILDTPLLKHQRRLPQLKEMIAEKGLEDTETLKVLHEHLEKYKWVEIFNFIGEELTFEKLIDQIKNSQKLAPHNLELKKVSPEAERVFRAAAYITYLRQVGAEYFSMYVLAIHPFLDRVAATLKISYRELLSIIPEEIIGFLESGDLVAVQKKVQKRKDGRWAMWSDHEQNIHITDDRDILSSLENRMLSKKTEGLNEVRGQVGNKGKAQGKVKIIISSDDFNTFQEGEVLVTGMTTPDFVPLMQKACAIVTEIGGLLSHAAIVSRELRKPCVIGTKIATDVLKDGDLVEVDAERGIVTVLKRSTEAARSTDDGIVKILEKVNEKQYWISSFSADECPYQLSVPYLEPGISIGRELVSNGIPHLITQCFMYYHGSRMDGGYFLEKEIQETVDAASELIYRDPDKVLQNHKETYKLNDEYLALARQCVRTNLKGLSNKELADLHAKLTFAQSRAHIWSSATTWFVDSYGGTFSVGLLGKTKEIIAKNSSKRNPAEVFTLLSTSPKNSFSLEEEIESLLVVREIMKDKKTERVFRDLRDYSQIPAGIPEKIQKSMTSHYEKWCWMPFGYYGPPYGMDYYLSVWAGLVREGISVEDVLQEKQGRSRVLERERLKLFETLDVPRDMRKVYDVAADITALKGYRKDCMYFGFYALDYIFKEISLRLSLPVSELHFLTYTEISDLLNGVVKYDTVERERREHTAIQYWDGEKLILLSGEKAEEFFRSKLVKQETLQSNEGSFVGTCACSGYAQGRVKIVNKTEEMGKMETGDIMVSHTTFPSLVPAMKKAAAIVTEDGGITCHAAIVAREMKKPCVTGIKVATQVLKDGDLVEVDADNGVVRILERASLLAEKR